MSEDMPNRVPEDLPDRMPEGMPDRMPEGMPDRMPDKMPDKVPEGMPDRMPEDLPDRMPDRMSEDMPEDMPDRVPEDTPEDRPEDMPGRMPEDMPDRMPDEMPDIMPEGMSDRMPEDLPVTKRINVMVRITRSKVICFFGGQTFMKSPEVLAIFPVSYVKKCIAVANFFSLSLRIPQLQILQCAACLFENGNLLLLAPGNQLFKGRRTKVRSSERTQRRAHMLHVWYIYCTCELFLGYWNFSPLHVFYIYIYIYGITVLGDRPVIS